MKNIVRSTLLLAVVSLALTGCGLKKGADSITGPGGDGVPTSVDFNFQLNVGSTTQSMRAANPAAINVDIGVGPETGDSLFVNGVLADPLGNPSTSWQARRFAGILLANGSLDRPFSVVVPNEQRDYEFALSFRHLGVEYQYLGPVSVNGTYLSAWNYTPYVIWRVFRYLPGGAIDPIRDDGPNYMWTECEVTGIVHPDSTHLNQPVSGAEPLSFLSTDTRLIENGGIYVDPPNSWRFPVLAKKDGYSRFFIRVNRPTGNSVLPGVFLRNADGSWTQLINLFDLDSGPGTYAVFEAVLGTDGKWSNPRPDQDERWGRIVIGRGAPNAALYSPQMLRYMTLR